MRVLLIGFALALATAAAAQPGGGGSRPSDEYWERQKQLEDDVERARKRLDEAIARWNAVR
jgi:hypothetical protein